MDFPYLPEIQEIFAWVTFWIQALKPSSMEKYCWNRMSNFYWRTILSQAQMKALGSN